MNAKQNIMDKASNRLKLILSFIVISLFVFEAICHEKRDWVIMVYMAADNDLHMFSWHNIKQMAKTANGNVYVVVQLNEPGRTKKTQRYLIEKNKAILLNPENTQKLDSGNAQTLIDFCVWTLKNFPAENNMLVLWNHGSGTVDYGGFKNKKKTFNYEPQTSRKKDVLFDLSIQEPIILTKNITFFNPLEVYADELKERGICFDETYHSYLTNQKLAYALKTICNQALNDKKISIIGCDACLMAMVEFANLAKEYANILIASEEVEYGSGWPYDRIIDALKNGPMHRNNLAKIIPRVYQDYWRELTKKLDLPNDCTLSSIDLENITKLEHAINHLSEILIDCLQKQQGKSVKLAIKECKAKINFEDPNYIDLGSFLINLKNNINKITSNSNLIDQLIKAINNVLENLTSIVIENAVGEHIPHAKGISIYLPEQKIHSSYPKTEFAQHNNWINFLSHYVA